MIGPHLNILSGFAFNSKQFNDQGDGMPLIRIRDVGKDSSETFYSGDFDEKFIVKPGDILIGMDGDFRLAVWQGERALLNQRVCKVESKGEVIDRGYLIHMLPRELQRIEDSTSYATVKHLSVKKIKAIEMPLPPLEEQKRIAGILDEADRVRKKTQALIDKYDELAQSLFLDMFGDPVTNPKGWDMIPLRKVCPLKRGYDLPVGSRRLGEIPVYGGNGQIGVHSEHKASGPGVVTGRSGTLGVVHYCFEDFWPLNTALYVTDFFDNEPKWISVMLAHFGLERFSRGAGVPTLNRNLVHDELVPNVPNRIQREFCSRLSAIEAQQKCAMHQLGEIETLFNALLQKAFKGEL